MSALRKIVKVEPVPREEALGEALVSQINWISNGTKARDVIRYESFTVTYSCGHTEQWLNRPKREQYNCSQCE